MFQFQLATIIIIRHYIDCTIELWATMAFFIFNSIIFCFRIDLFKLLTHPIELISVFVTSWLQLFHLQSHRGIQIPICRVSSNVFMKFQRHCTIPPTPPNCHQTLRALSHVKMSSVDFQGIGFNGGMCIRLPCSLSAYVANALMFTIIFM